MKEILICSVTAALLLLIFYLWGEALCLFLKIRVRRAEAAVIGLFAVMTLFQILFLPAVFTLRPFHSLKNVSLFVIFLLTAAALFLVIRRGLFIKENRDGGTDRPLMASLSALPPAEKVLTAVMAAAVIVTFFFVLFRPYHGWDTAYYIGTMNENIATDTLYQYDGSTGFLRETIEPRYALSGFYTLFTVFASLFHIHPLLAAYYVIRPVGLILSFAVVYLIGREIFRGSVSSAVILTGLFCLVQLCWVSIYNSSFFVERMYEAKGYCAFILLPYAGLQFLRLGRRGGKRRTAWTALAVTAVAAIPVSMSSLALYPAAVLVGGAALLTCTKERLPVIRRCLLLIIPNLTYIVLYALMLKELIVVHIR